MKPIEFLVAQFANQLLQDFILPWRGMNMEIKPIKNTYAVQHA